MYEFSFWSSLVLYLKNLMKCVMSSNTTMTVILVTPQHQYYMFEADNRMAVLRCCMHLRFPKPSPHLGCSLRCSSWAVVVASHLPPHLPFSLEPPALTNASDSIKCNCDNQQMIDSMKKNRGLCGLAQLPCYVIAVDCAACLSNIKLPLLWQPADK